MLGGKGDRIWTEKWIRPDSKRLLSWIQSLDFLSHLTLALLKLFYQIILWCEGLSGALQGVSRLHGLYLGDPDIRPCPSVLPPCNNICCCQMSPGYRAASAWESMTQMKQKTIETTIRQLNGSNGFLWINITRMDWVKGGQMEKWRNLDRLSKREKRADLRDMGDRLNRICGMWGLGTEESWISFSSCCKSLGECQGREAGLKNVGASFFPKHGIAFLENICHYGRDVDGDEYVNPMPQGNIRIRGQKFESPLL